MIKAFRRLSAFILALSTVLALTMQLPALSVSADVGQPEIYVPALEDVHCQSYCVYDKTTGKIIMSQKADEKCFPASMTKVMTCMLSLEILDTDEKLTVSKEALAGLGNDSSLMGVKEGEKVKVSELLYGLMLPSGNDAANVLAEGCVEAFFNKFPADGEAVNKDGVNSKYITDTLRDTKENILNTRKIEAFAALMNLRAEKIGCKGTHFTNACGLHDDNHYITAQDMCTIMAAATDIPEFNMLISAPSHVFKATNRHRAEPWSYVKNSNNLLYDPWLATKTANGLDSHLAAIIGGKTGTTSQAGKCLTLYTVCKNGHDLMVTVCNVPPNYQFYLTMYVASVTAYGNLACWKTDPVERVYGTTGDYKSVNAPADQQPQYDGVEEPGKEPADYYPATPTPTPTPTPSPETEEEMMSKYPPLVLFVKQNTGISVTIAVIMLAIIIMNIVLMIRVNILKHGRTRIAKRRTPNIGK
ncbi:MAG: serine hydrolase [Saccharofermentans sp.]|nr:serine hydrolase [Saccharofermentans sp.]